jgi:hypothetical protein
MPEPEPPLTPEEDEAMNRLAEQWLQTHVNIFTPLYVLLSGICAVRARALAVALPGRGDAGRRSGVIVRAGLDTR